MPALHPLTPEYVPGKHGVYFNAIKDALDWTGNKKVRNVALTGSYGVGKSSILRQVADDESLKAIQVSLSTLGFKPTAEASKQNGSDDKSDGAENPLRDTKTNQIQKEIVKQLLYTQMPEKMPGSRYRRTAAFNWTREILLALASGIPLAIVIFLFGWTAKLATLFTAPADWAIAANGGMAVVAVALVLGVRFVTHNKLRIDSVSTGAATITLSAKSDTYFDEYLDEIVYFFQVVDADIVIFEDIDRFEDPHIFETLRELNTILNAAKQLNDRTIRFIYAIKDSIFEELGVRAAREADGQQPDAKKPTSDAAILEVARANRTKFFDLVIPVVPFVTHQSARELMSNELKDLKEHKVSDDLVDLVAQHVADMRLIRNIRNEFAIFKEHVIRKSSLQLSDDHLFAMVLYKSTHLSDFERIKLGTSNLDTLYKESRQIVSEKSTLLSAEITRLQRRLRLVGDQSERADAIGSSVDAYIELIIGHIGGSFNDVRYGGTATARSDLHTEAFWRKYTNEGENLSFAYYDQYRNLRVSNLTAEELRRATGDDLDPSEWEKVGREDLENKIRAARDDLAYFSKSDMKEFMTRSDVKVTVEGASMSFADRAMKLLGSKLATDLVTQGYIDRYFTLYTSTFPGDRVNANAMNFILKNVDAGSMDFFFKLTAAEANAVFKERPRISASGKAAYNLDFVNYLLSDAKAVKAKAAVLANIRRYGDDERQFVQEFLTSDRNAAALARELARSWADVMVSLVEDLELEDFLRLKLVDAALSGLMPDVEYAVSDTAAAYLSDHYAELDAFNAAKGKPAVIAQLLKTGNVEIPDLSVLSPSIRDAVVSAEQFTVTRSNLFAAIAPHVDLSLDSIKKISGAVYRRAIRSIGDYLASLEEAEASISDPSSFVGVITDIDKVDRAALSGVVGKSVPECRVESLASVIAGTWRALAVHDRFPPTFANVVSYAEEWGVDANLAVVLGSGSLVVPAGTDEEDKRELALQLAQSAGAITSADLRASLIESLHLASKLEADSIPPEDGEWVGRLIERGVIEDSAESFGLLNGDDWAGLEYAIAVSSELPSFIDSEVLPSGLVPSFLDSTSIPSSLKATIVERFDEFADGADRAVIVRMATYALDQNVSIEWTAVVRVAQARAGSSIVLRLVQRFNDSVTIEHLRPILTALAGDYPQLLSANGTHPKVPNTVENVSLLQRMQRLGTVKTFSGAGSKLKANMKRS